MCHQLVFGLLLSVLLAYVMLFCHKGVVERGVAESTELVGVSNVLVLFVRRRGRGGEGSRMFLWGCCFCRVKPNSWSVTQLRCKIKSNFISLKHALNKPQTPQKQTKSENVRTLDKLMPPLPLPFTLWVRAKTKIPIRGLNTREKLPKHPRAPLTPKWQACTRLLLSPATLPKALLTPKACLSCAACRAGRARHHGQSRGAGRAQPHISQLHIPSPQLSAAQKPLSHSSCTLHPSSPAQFTLQAFHWSLGLLRAFSKHHIP